ncbi:MAG: class I SAM-dependent methyltransferase [Candidatus Hadarchaeales archaeon]
MGPSSLPGEPFPSIFVPLYYLEAVFRRGSYRTLASEITSRLSRGRILDVGTGPGLLPLELALRSPWLEVVGVDPSPGMIALARRLCREAEGRVDFIVGGVYRLPFPSPSFDMVVSVGVLHHLLDLPKALAEILRVLKPGGEAWLYEVVMDAEWVEVRRTFREMKISPFPALLLFSIHRLLSRVAGGRRIIGMREEDVGRLEDALKVTELSWGMERRGSLLKVVLEKDGR